MRAKQISLLLFTLFSVCYIWADMNQIPLLTLGVKPVLMPLLGAYFYWSIKDNFKPVCRYILIALVFATAGDTFLMFVDQSQLYFVLGLGSFLLTHVFYIIAFKQLPSKNQAGFLRKQSFWGLPFLALLICLLLFLWPDIPSDLQIPVAIYSCTIMVMALMALNLNHQVSNRVFTLLFIGALLFVFSDSMIALNKFKSEQLTLPDPRLFIMVPYLVGQFLIVKGAIEEINLE